MSVPWSGVSSISPVSNSQAIICRVLKPALPATLRQFILLPLVVTRPPSVLCSCSPVFFIRLFSIPSFFRFISCRASQQCWSCSTQLLWSSCKPKVTYSLCSLSCPPARCVFLWISSPLWTIWNLDHLCILHLLWTLSWLTPPVLTSLHF